MRFPRMACVACSIAMLWPAISSPATVERIVARVNGDIITRTEWDEMVDMTIRSNGGKKLTADERSRMAGEVLERMISDRLIIQAADASGLKVTDAEVAPDLDREMDRIQSQFKSGRDFDEQLRKEGLTRDDLRWRMTNRIKERYLYLKILNRRQREIESAVEIPDEEIAGYAAAHSSTTGWMTEPSVRARNIQFTIDPALSGEKRKTAVEEAMKKAEAARAALKRGDAFEDVAKVMSEDTLTRENGGDLGAFSRGTYNEAIEKAAFSLKPGQVSVPIESPAGIHLIKVEEIIKPKLRGLDEKITVPAPRMPGATGAETEEITLREHIKGLLRHQKMSKGLQDWVDGLKKTALIQRYKEEPSKP